MKYSVMFFVLIMVSCEKSKADDCECTIKINNDTGEVSELSYLEAVDISNSKDSIEEVCGELVYQSYSYPGGDSYSGGGSYSYCEP